MGLMQIFLIFSSFMLYLLLWMLFPMYLGKKAAISITKVETKKSLFLSSRDWWIIYPLGIGIFALMIFFWEYPSTCHY